MAPVSIRTGITSADSLSELSQEQWPMLMELRRMFCKRSLPGDCRLLLRFIEDGRAGNFAGFDDETSYIRDGLGLDPEAVRWAVEGLEITGSDVPVPFADAVESGKLRAHGGDRRSQEARDQADNISLKHGTSTAYTLARLDRDNPELANAVREGRLSANAAAIEAGFRHKPTTLEQLQKLWRRASEEDRQSFREYIRREAFGGGAA